MGARAPHTEETRPLWAAGPCGEERGEPGPVLSALEERKLRPGGRTLSRSHHAVQPGRGLR